VGKDRPGRVPSPELVEEARRFPGGWVYEIDGTFGPMMRCRRRRSGGWAVGSDGQLTGHYEANPRYRPKR
jgi:hypothetical protein